MKIEHLGVHETVFTQDEDDNNHRTSYTWDSTDIPQNVLDYVDENGLWSDEVREQYALDFPAPTADELAANDLATEQAWVVSELSSADIEIRKHEDGAARVKGANVQAWRTYRNDLRDYVQSGVVTGERPVKP